MKTLKSRIFGVLLALVLVAGGAVESRAFTIGVDAEGGGAFQDITLINYFTDTGLAVGFIPVIPTPFDIEFILQGRVSGFQNGGTPVIFSGLALQTGEMTFVTKFTETVTDVQTVGGTTTATFQSGEDLAGLLQFYAQPAGTFTGPGDATHANPNAVSGYTDGTPILTAHIMSQNASFSSTVPGLLGTGSFDVVFKVDSFDANYWDIPVDLFLLRFHTTGTLNQPSTFTPPVMWDGTSFAAAAAAGLNPQYLKFDGSTDFTVVPEPSTILLLGFGLVGAGFLARRKK